MGGRSSRRESTVRYAVVQLCLPLNGLRRAALDVYMAVRYCAVGSSVILVNFVLMFCMASTDAYGNAHFAHHSEIGMACNPWIVELPRVSVREHLAG